MKRCEDCFSLFEEQYGICPHCGYVQKNEADEIYQLMPGDVLDNRYIVGRVLGYGGFGNTYKAWDTKLEMVVAIKEYYPSGLVNRIPGTRDVILFTQKRVSDYQYGRRSFLEEARNMAKFSGHPNIVEVFHYFEENNTAYFVMEYLEGVPLSTFLRQNGGKTDVDTALVVAEAICDALAVLHEANIIHRDVSPDNIFICTNNVIKLIDFGAARFSQQDKKLSIILKPGYAPPEQYDSVNDQGSWTDIYALGASLYLALTGVKPDESTNRKITDTVQEIRALSPEISENLSNTIMKAIAVDHHMRFRTVAEFKKALLGEKKISSLSSELKKRKKFRVFSVLFSIFLVGLTGFWVVNSWISKRDEQYLRSASISVWFATESGSKESAAMESIKSQFCSAFPEVEIELVAIPEEEYADWLEEALQSGQLPNLFESTDADESILAQAADVGGIMEAEQIAECYFLDSYYETYEDCKQIPLAINIPTAYLITNGHAFTEYSEKTWVSLGDFEETVALEESTRTLWENTLGTRLERTADPEKFFDTENNTAAILLSTTADYNRVREMLTGYTKHCSFYTGGPLCAEFTYEWSIGGGTEDEVRAAERLLEWMLGAPFQNILMISTCQDGQIPLNRSGYLAKCSGELEILRDLQETIYIGKDEKNE